MYAAFQPDPQLPQQAESYARDAVAMAAANFSITLDGTEDSIRLVEDILSRLHDILAAHEPDPEVTWLLARAFGSYVGEVFRKTHGAAWGQVTLGDQTHPGLQTGPQDLSWPWHRAHKRLTRGNEGNMLLYYLALTPKTEAPSERPRGL